jgi:hypothetical protein
MMEIVKSEKMPNGHMNRYRGRNFNAHTIVQPFVGYQKILETEGGLKMRGKNKYPVAILLLLIFVIGCASLKIGKGEIDLREDLILNEYIKIRRIVIEEAAKNGFPTLKSEVKPLEINGWKGKLYFILKTEAGWDNLTVKFKRKGDKFVIEMVGASTVANAKGAVEGIKARLSEL